ncbi:MAG: hypothetical protein FH749_05525 [Firmicutes bacterium]|nr:hypothetical protein [Bacillota bacterium]
MSKGYILLETLVATALSLLILTVAATQLYVFWQMWHTTNDQARQRHWAAQAYDSLATDAMNAKSVSILSDRAIFYLDSGLATYRLTPAGSFYRNWQNRDAAFADKVQAVDWQLDDDVLWMTLIYKDGQTYRSCFQMSNE